MYLLSLIWLAPILTVILGVAASRRISRGRWLIHILVFAALVFALPATIYLQGYLDPTTIEGPGGGEGFVVLLYAAVLIPSAIYYGIFAWTLRRQKSQRA
jgi:hypothetical protein